MDEVCITLFKSDAILLPLIVLRRSLVHTVNIGERPRLGLLKVSFLGPACITGKMGPTKDGLDFM